MSYTMDSFRKDVKTAFDKNTASSHPSKETPSDSSTDSTSGTAIPYKVEVTITNLNIRKGPGTNYVTTGTFTGKGIFTIIEESSGKGAPLWGKLKSGAGWISLDYAKKYKSVFLIVKAIHLTLLHQIFCPFT